MTSSLPRKLAPGFTLIELLVVISIIVLLATILLPMINMVYRQASRASMAADLQIIGQALEAYKHDFGDYPRMERNPSTLQNENLPDTTNGFTGAAVLCWALVAPGPATDESAGKYKNPGDGAQGPGFRVRGTAGSVKGPYLPADRFHIGFVDGLGVVQSPQVDFNDSIDVLADRNNSPILYFPATPGANPTSAPNGFISPAFVFQNSGIPLPPCLFYFGDNGIYLTGPNSNLANLTRKTGWKVMAYRLGDIGSGATGGGPNGIIDLGETAVTTGPYLLWSAGPDGIFGNDDDVMSDGAQLQQVTGLLPTTIAP